jgi:TonB-dependent receptor
VSFLWDKSIRAVPSGSRPLPPGSGEVAHNDLGGNMNIRRNRLWNTHLPRFSLASSMLVLAAGPAFAQSGTELEAVVVTGYRGSLAKALGDKRDEVVAIDSIYAEDVSKFPDLNLADSLQRLPGVAIARDAGEGRQISVRGLGPQFTRVRINGIEALSTTGGTDSAGGTNRDRAFDFNVFASELFNQLAVRKTASADVEEGSLGATVDLRTARPFDFDRTTVVVSGQFGYNDLSEDNDPRGSALFSTVFADGRMGALLSASYSERTLLEEGASTVRWQTGNFQALGAGYAASGSTATLAQLNAAFKPRIPRYDHYEHEQERLGVTGSFQFQPSDDTLFSLDALYSKLDARRVEIFLESPVFSTAGAAGIGDVEVQAAEIDSTNTLVYGVFDDVDIRSESRLDHLSTEFTQVTLEGEHRLNDRVTIRGLAGFAESKHDNPIQTTLLFDRLNVDGYVYDYRGNSRLPLISYGNAPIEDPTAWTLTQIRLRPQSADNDLTTALADLTFALSDNVQFLTGLQWKEYEFGTAELRRSNGSTANLEGSIPASVAATPIAQYSQLLDFGAGLNVPSGTTTTWLIPDMTAANSLFDLYNTANFPMGIEPALGNNRSVKEEDVGFYAQLNFRSDLMPLRGNIGLRYATTDQTASGYTFTSGAPLATTVERDYENWLPSMNLALDLGEEIVVRIGAARAITRPGLGSLTPGASVSVSGNNRTVTAGNPNLDPFEADTFDLGFEWYFADESLFSLAFFYKDVKTFVQTIRETRPFTGNPLGLPDSVAIAACGATVGCSPSADWQFNLPANTPGGKLDGYEIGYQAPFSFLPAPFDNFGAILNYTNVSSTIKYLNATGQVVLETDLTGLSGEAYNATLYYEQGGFGARVSAAYRDEYLTTAPGRNGNNVEGTAATLTVDFSASWSPSDQLTVTLEGINLTDEFSDQWVDSVGDRLSVYHHTGRQYFVGARYKF